ncbi:hypothetical protein EYI23_02595 [Bacillus subtilis]|nr:hypothetical protein [Bacillus subtilis]
MIINRSCLKEFAEKLHSLPSSLTKSDLLTDPFRLHQENELAIYYSPHNEFINRDASLVIAGITPGFFQMKTAYETAAETVCETLIRQHRLQNLICLSGFPHPSGANGHRLKQFAKNKELLERQIHSFAFSVLNFL